MDQEKKTEKPKRTNQWLEHVKKVREANPDLVYKEVLSRATETYTPKGKKGKDSPKEEKQEKPKEKTPKKEEKPKRQRKPREEKIFR